MIRQTTILALLLAVALSLVLFAVKYQVRDLELELTRLDRAIASEKRALHVLSAEWSHLNQPSRLALLAERHLQMKPTLAEQLASFDRLPPSQSPPDGENPGGTLQAALASRRSGSEVR
jgi:cell division protein FtsL